MGHHLFETFWGIFWRMGQALLYALCVERLRHSFRNTKYESSPRTFIVCYGGIFIFVSGYLVKVFLYSFFNATGQRDEFVYALVGDIEMGITQILDFTLSIGIMVVFMRKLHELNTDLADIGDTHSPTKSIANRSNVSTHSGLKQDDYRLLEDIHDSADIPSTVFTLGSTASTPAVKRKLSLNEQQKSIIDVMAKITLLSGVALASSQIVFILSGLLYIAFMVPHYAEYQQILTSVKLGYVALNTVIISTSIVLGFDFSYHWYKKACCIDRICIKCCTKTTKRKMGKSLARRDHVWLSPGGMSSVNRD